LGKVDWRTDDVDYQSQDADGKHENPCNQKPACRDERVRSAVCLTAQTALSRCMVHVHRPAPVQGACLYCNAKKQCDPNFWSYYKERNDQPVVLSLSLSNLTTYLSHIRYSKRYEPPNFSFCHQAGVVGTGGDVVSGGAPWALLYASNKVLQNGGDAARKLRA